MMEDKQKRVLEASLQSMYHYLLSLIGALMTESIGKTAVSAALRLDASRTSVRDLTNSTEQSPS
jgi:hypothetical protein